MTPPSLRVTIVGLNYAPEPTGISPYTSGLAEGLTAAGHSVHVVTGYPHYPEWKLQEGYRGWGRTETVNGVVIRRLRHHIPRSPTALSRVLMELSFGARIFFARWEKPDVVLVVSPALISSALAIFRVRMSPNRPVVGIWVQDLYSRGLVETGGGRLLGWIAGFVEGSVLKAADGVVAIHDRFKSYITESLGVSADDVKVIRNWTHTQQSPTSGLSEMRVHLGWDPQDIVVLHAGNMGKKQGLENVLNAARMAEENQSKVRFVLMGDGNRRRKLQALGSGLDHVGFLPPLPGDEFLRALAAADILLVNELPGVRDMAVPSKLTSYFNAGRPVIAATDAESVTATEIRASRGGLRVDAADPQALLSAAERIGSDKDVAGALGEAGLRYRLETMSEDAAFRHFDEFIRNLASLRRS